VKMLPAFILILANAGVYSLPVKNDILDNVFISVKTSGKFHKTRLTPVLDTWYKSAADHTWFFTDIHDAELGRRISDGHLINTGCPDDHSRTALSCKMEAELSTFLDVPGRPDWFCHVDDDNYVNVKRLKAELNKYSADEDWYLGKVSISQPLEIMDRLVLPEHRRVRFWFATGGAGFCISRSLAEKMRPWIEEGKFKKLADDIRLPDDVAVGYVIEVLLGVKLQQIPQLHSHLEALRLVTDFDNAITMSYSTYQDNGQSNIVELSGKDNDLDPTRFYAIHCQLHPDDCVKPQAIDEVNP